MSHTQKQAQTPEQIIAQGELLQQSGRHREALAVADQVLAASPGLASAWLLRGSACRDLHRFGDAATAFQVILAQFPDFTRIRMQLANAQAELGALDEAQKQLQEAVRREPDSAAAHAGLGSAYIRQDRYDLAEAPSRQALALDETNIIAHQNLAAILALRDDPEAHAHRDAAYRRQQLFAEPSSAARRTVLILTASGSGNVPYLHLLPRDRFNRILWYLEYAPPGQEADLPPHDFVFNAVGDPDAADAALTAAQGFAARCARPLFNAPANVARSLRSHMPAVLGDLPGVLVPETRRYGRGADLAAGAVNALGLRFPLILRPAGRHGGKGVRLVDGPQGWVTPPGQDFYATEFVEYRSVDGWYRKYRMIFVDGELYPYHLAIGRRWLLHYVTADMQGDALRRAEEEAFLRDPTAVLGAAAMATLRAIASRLGLDYAGIDFSLLPDGRLLFFEANATMLVHPEEDPLLAHKNKAAAAIAAGMEAMIERRLGFATTAAH